MIFVLLIIGIVLISGCIEEGGVQTKTVKEILDNPIEGESVKIIGYLDTTSCINYLQNMQSIEELYDSTGSIFAEINFASEFTLGGRPIYHNNTVEIIGTIYTNESCTCTENSVCILIDMEDIEFLNK
ncbi:MAG: hypothetical protein ACE5KE_01485 [Methanosarcinales archaeon]